MEQIQQPRLSRRGFVTTAVAAGVLAAAGGAALYSIDEDTGDTLAEPTEEWPLTAAARPVRLRAGDMIVADQRYRGVLHVRGDRASEIVRLRTWSNTCVFGAVASRRSNRLWVSLAGLKVPQGGIYYGLLGVGRIVEIDLTTGKLTRVFAAPEFVDPAGMLLTHDERALYVADFTSFGKAGRILRLDLGSGKVDLVAEGNHLSTPVGINFISPDRIVVGSAEMAEVNPAGTGGRIVEVDLATGEQTLVHEHVRRLGVVLGAVKLPDGTYVGTRSGWPYQATTAVFATRGGSDMRILSAPQPAFYSSGIAAAEGGVWAAESTRRQLHLVRLDGQVARTVQLPGERVHKLQHAEDTLESVSIVA